MIALLRRALDAGERQATLDRLRGWARENRATVRGPGAGLTDSVEIGLPPGSSEEDLARALRAVDGIAAVLTAARPIFHVDGSGKDPLQVRIGDARFGAGVAACIAGPCAVEDEELLRGLAGRLRAAGATALRGGAYKPRTSPHSFQGLGPRGLEILATVSRETGLPVVTEVLDTRDVARVAEHAAMLQIGSRNMMNYALLKEAGAAGTPVLLKRGMSSTLAEFLQAAEYLAAAGCDQIVLCERGLRHFDPALRNLLDLSAIPALRAETHLPVVVDPSHGTGRADLVSPMLAAAAAAGADGFLVEVHPTPPESVSDAGQALDPSQFEAALGRVEAVLQACGRTLARPASRPQLV